MEPRQPHRKRVRHYHDPGDFHELTFSCYRRLPLLTNSTWRHLLSQAIDRALTRHAYRLVAFVQMPEHVHLLVLPSPDSPGVDSLLRAIKRPMSFRIKQHLVNSKSRLLQQLTVHQRPGVTTFRFWQEGPGYDRNLSSPRAIRSAIDYLHANPIRRGLCLRAVDWRWSSARHFASEGHVVDPLLPTVHGLPPDFFDPRDGS